MHYAFQLARQFMQTFASFIGCLSSSSQNQRKYINENSLFVNLPKLYSQNTIVLLIGFKFKIHSYSYWVVSETPIIEHCRKLGSEQPKLKYLNCQHSKIQGVCLFSLSLKNGSVILKKGIILKNISSTRFVLKIITLFTKLEIKNANLLFQRQVLIFTHDMGILPLLQQPHALQNGFDM